MMCINTIDLAQCGQPRGSADRSEARPRYAGARDCCHSEGRCGYAVPAESVSYTRTSGGLDRGGGGHVHQADDVVPVFFLSDSTGISAETMGNALLIQFPDTRFERTLFPFITTVQEARRVVALLDEAMDGPVTPLVFTTAADDTVRSELAKTRAPVIDFFDIHMSRVEEILGLRGLHEAARLHGVGDIRSYNTRMAAVEFTIEHDDG